MPTPCAPLDEDSVLCAATCMDDGALDAEYWAIVSAEPVSVWESDTSALTVNGRLALLQRIERERARLAAREAEVLVSLIGAEKPERTVRIDDPEGDRVRTFDLVDEDLELVATGLGQSVAVVRRRAMVARALATVLPRTRALLEAGRLSPEHAEAIARHVQGMPVRALARYESRVLVRVGSETPSQVATRARRLRARLDAAGEEARRRAARRHVDVRMWMEDDGLACLQARLPFADAARLHAALEERARGVDVPDGASVGERRVAALVDAVCGAGEGGTGSAAATGVHADVQVVIDAATLAAMSQGDEVDDAGHAMVAFGGGRPEPVTVGALREWLADPRVPVALRRLVTEPISGALLDRGRRAYRAPESLRAFLVARDGVCRFPGCLRAAEQCDTDHVVGWEDGGRTDRVNLIRLCRRHHVQKTHGSWSIVEARPDGRVRWRAPDGGLHTSYPFGAAQGFTMEMADP